MDVGSDDGCVVIATSAVDAVDAVLARCVASSKPLLVRGGYTGADAAARAVDALTASPAARARTVRVACSLSRRFSGRHDEEQHVTMRLGTWADHAAAASDDPLAATGAAYYLSQCSVRRPVGRDECAELPELAAAVGAPSWLPAAAAGGEVNLWASARQETTSETHYDAEHNLLCVARGEKLVALAAPERAARLRAHSPCSPSAHHAREPLLPEHAMPTGSVGTAAPAAVGSRSIRVTLRGGDALFIPEGWWHSVRSAPHTLAFNFWWPGLRAEVCRPHVAPYMARALLAHLAAERVVQRREDAASAALHALEAAAASEEEREAAAVAAAAAHAAAGQELMPSSQRGGSSREARLFTSLLATVRAAGVRDGGRPPIAVPAGRRGADDDGAPPSILRLSDAFAAGGTGLAAALPAALLLLPSQAAFDVLTAAPAHPVGGDDARWTALAAVGDMALDAVAARWEHDPPLRVLGAVSGAGDDAEGAVAVECAFADLWMRCNNAAGSEAFPGRIFAARERLASAALAEVVAELVG